jgi:anti-sigma factor RsiW
MTCNNVRDNLVAYLYSELDNKTVMALHRHLCSCEACVQEEIELLKTKRLLDKSYIEAMPGNFDEQLDEKLKRNIKSRYETFHDFRRIVYAVAATFILTIGLQFLSAHLTQTMQMSTRFKDFPTVQTVFKSESRSAEPSLKERLMQRYVRARLVKMANQSTMR